MPTALALDMDGTLLRSDGSLSPRTLRAIAEVQRRGVRVIIATGRRRSSALRDLVPPLDMLPGVFLNGAEVWLDGEVIGHSVIAADAARAIAEFIEREYPENELYADVGGKLYVNRQTEYPGAHCVPSIAAILDADPHKMTFRLGDGVHVGVIEEVVPEGCQLIITSLGEWGEFVAPGVSKAAGIRVLLSRWGIEMEDLVAIGDDLNDREMILEAGVGVAMGNGVPDLLTEADIVAPTNDEDGVAVIIEEIWLQDD